VELTTQSKPEAATHWSTRKMATELGVAPSTVMRHWQAHGLKPHIVRGFKVSRNPKFVEKLEDIVGMPWCFAATRRVRCRRWIARSRDSASWLNMVERFFRDLTTDRLRRGVFTSVPGLVAAIDEYVAYHNTEPKPFIWTKSARDILLNADAATWRPTRREAHQ